MKYNANTDILSEVRLKGNSSFLHMYVFNIPRGSHWRQIINFIFYKLS